MLAAASVIPTAPDYNSGASTIRNYLAKHHSQLGPSTVLTGAATLFLIVFLGW
jgi:hypothetical protein